VNTGLDAETQRLVDIAVAGAPALTTAQITELRRILKPEQRLRAIPGLVQPIRKAALARRAA
jgi:hypothetical protein